MKTPLTTKQKQQLKALGHPLKPVVMIADQGLKETVIQHTDEALRAHELIKLKIRTDDRETRAALLNELCSLTSAELVSQTGFTALIYRRNREKPVIELVGRAGN